MAKKIPSQQCRGDKRPKNIPEVTEVLRTGVREERGVWDWLATGTGKAREWGRGIGGAALAPDSREGFWDLSGDPYAHPPGARQGPGLSYSGDHFNPKIFAQLFQEDKGEDGVRNEPDGSRNEALEGDSDNGESQYALGPGLPCQG